MRAEEFTPDGDLAVYVEGLGNALSSTQSAETSQFIEEVGIGTAYSREADTDVFHTGSVYGAAILGDEETQYPALLVDYRLVSGELTEGTGRIPPLEGFRQLRDLLEHSGVFPTPDTRVLPMGPPRPQFDPGGLVTGVGVRGTLGARVRSALDEPGVLTAGHLATRGSFVHDAVGRIGSVVFSVDPAQVPATRITADIAVVVPSGAAPSTTGPDLYRGVGKADPGTPVTIFGAASGVQQAQVMGLVVPALYVPSMSGQWATPYMLTHAASTAGDSGAPVIRTDTQELIGHVVGGDEAFTTFVQSIDVQVEAAGATVL